MTVYFAKTFHRVFTAVDCVRITYDYLMTTRYFVPCYFRLMFTQTLLRESDETAC